MGTFRVAIEVGDPEGKRYQPLEALVDTGATYLVVPRSILASLGVQRWERRPFTMADGRQVEYEVGFVSLRLDGRSGLVLAVFGEEGTGPLLGAVALETFGMGVDPLRRRLVKLPGLLM